MTMVNMIPILIICQIIFLSGFSEAGKIINLQAKDSPQYLTSPGFPQNPQRKTRAHWRIFSDKQHKIRIEFIMLSLLPKNAFGLCMKQKLIFTDFDKSKIALCGRQLPPSMTSVGSAVNVSFYSELSTQVDYQIRFKLKYFHVEKDSAENHAGDATTQIPNKTKPNTAGKNTEGQRKVTSRTSDRFKSEIIFFICGATFALLVIAITFGLKECCVKFRPVTPLKKKRKNRFESHHPDASENIPKTKRILSLSKIISEVYEPSQKETSEKKESKLRKTTNHAAKDEEIIKKIVKKTSNQKNAK